MEKTFDKKEAIRIVSAAAKEYQKNLEGLNLIFIYKSRQTNKIEFFESIFRANNFQHLTGLEQIDENRNLIKNADLFYQKCLNNKLKESEICEKSDGTTVLKLKALPQIVKLTNNTKMTGLYNGNGIKLAVDRLVGSVYFCLGFKLEGSYYLPSSCLLEDIRNITNAPSQILAVLSKSVKEKELTYGEIRYEAKGFKLSNASLAEDIKSKLSSDIWNV